MYLPSLQTDYITWIHCLVYNNKNVKLLSMFSHSSYANFKRLLRNYVIKFLMVILEQRLRQYIFYFKLLFYWIRLLRF